MLVHLNHMIWPSAYEDFQRDRLNPVNTHQYIQFTEQLHVSTKRDHQAGHRKEKTNVQTAVLGLRSQCLPHIIIQKIHEQHRWINFRIKIGKTCKCVSSEIFQEKWGKERAAINDKIVKTEKIQACLGRQPVTISLQWSLVYRLFLSISITILLEENGGLVGHSFLLET